MVLSTVKLKKIYIKGLCGMSITHFSMPSKVASFAVSPLSVLTPF